MPIFNRSNYYNQYKNITEDGNRIVEDWKFTIDFTDFFSFYTDAKLEDMNTNFKYNVKSVDLPKYSMRTYKRYFGGAERSFPVRRISDGVFKVTFYARYYLIQLLSNISRNYIGSSEKKNGINTVMMEKEKSYRRFIHDLLEHKIPTITVTNYADTLYDDASRIRYIYVNPTLSTIDYSELGSENNGILEVTCEFQYRDFRILTDTCKTPKYKNFTIFDEFDNKGIHKKEIMIGEDGNPILPDLEDYGYGDDVIQKAHEDNRNYEEPIEEPTPTKELEEEITNTKKESVELTKENKAKIANKNGYIKEYIKDSNGNLKIQYVDPDFYEVTKELEKKKAYENNAVEGR